MRMPPGTRLGTLGASLWPITYSVFLEMVISVDLLLCGTIIKVTVEHKEQ
jgi:hypothetical protein